MQTDKLRVLRVSGTRNLRDLGGYATRDGRRTRWRTVYRSDSLDQVDAEGQLQLVQAGLRSIIDLRDDAEVAERPNVFANSAHVIYRRVPMFDEPLPPNVEPDAANGYLRVINLCGRRLVAVMQEVLSPGARPVLIHCAAGKDRTGLVVALLLAAVGVPDQTIVEDYTLSSACLGPEYIAASRQWVVDRGLDWQRWAHVFETPPERMLMTLAYLEHQFGGAEPYLRKYGLAHHQMAELRERLTEASE